MQIKSILVHDMNPGSSANCLEEQLSTLSIPAAQVGVEMDVTYKKIPGTPERQGPVAISRDSKFRVDLLEHIESFVSKGFKGPYFLDVTNRRACASVLDAVSDEKCSQRGIPYENVFIQLPEMALSYKTPWAKASGNFNVDELWSKAWQRLTVTSRFADLAREFTSQGMPVNLFWEPVDDLDYRKSRLDLIKNSQVILYKMPHLTHTALFDPNICMERDLDFFNSIPNDITVIPLGSVEIFREHKNRLFSTESTEELLKTDSLIKIDSAHLFHMKQRSNFSSPFSQRNIDTNLG